MTAGTEASTRWPSIPKNVRALVVPPNLVDYDETCATSTWDQARQALSGLPGNRGLNIAHEAVDRHAAGARAHREALRFVRGDGSTHSLSYAQLAAQSSSFASVLRGLGIERGDRVFSLLGRVPELRHVLLVDADGHPEPGTLDLGALLAAAPPDGEIAATQGEDMALLHFTSGTTGTPKGAIHVHDAVIAHYAAGRFALDLHPDDIYWCTADPGWVTGTSYGIISPLVYGVTAIIDEEELDADRWCRVLAEQRVTVWYTAPTALRMLMKAGIHRATGHDLSALRFVASVGEPLNPEVMV